MENLEAFTLYFLTEAAPLWSLSVDAVKQLQFILPLNSHKTRSLGIQVHYCKNSWKLPVSELWINLDPKLYVGQRARKISFASIFLEMRSHYSLFWWHWCWIVSFLQWTKLWNICIVAAFTRYSFLTHKLYSRISTTGAGKQVNRCEV